MHLYWLHVYTTVFFTQRTLILSICLILWFWSMVHRGKKLLSNRSADVFGMLLFSHQFVAAFSSRTSMSTWAFRMGRFFQLGKKVPEKMMGLLRMQPELKVYGNDWFHWLEYLKTDGILVLGHCGEVRGVPIRWRLFAVWWVQNLAFHSISTIFNMTLDWFVVSISSCQFGGWSEHWRINFDESRLFFWTFRQFRHYVLGVKPRFRDKAFQRQRNGFETQTWDTNGLAGWQNVWWI